MLIIQDVESIIRGLQGPFWGHLDSPSSPRFSLSLSYGHTSQRWDLNAVALISARLSEGKCTEQVKGGRPSRHREVTPLPYATQRMSDRAVIQS